MCGRGRKRESWDSSLERETAGLPTPLYFKAVDIINDYQVESHYINFFLMLLSFILFEMVNSSNLPNNYNVTEQATYLVSVRVNVQDGVQTHDCPLLGCGLSDII